MKGLKRAISRTLVTTLVTLGALTLAAWTLRPKLPELQCPPDAKPVQVSFLFRPIHYAYYYFYDFDDSDGISEPLIQWCKSHSGLAHGPVQMVDRYKVTIRGNYRDGMEDGEFFECRFDNDCNLLSGSLDNVHHWTMKDGRKNGSNTYSKNRVVTIENNYNMGKLEGNQIYLYDSGILHSIGSYVNGNQEGCHVQYAETGDLMDFECFDHDLNDGPHFEIDGERRWILQANYAKGKIDGLYRIWYEHSEQVKYQANFQNGQPTGEWYLWDAEGHIIASGSVREGAGDFLDLRDNSGLTMTRYDNGSNSDSFIIGYRSDYTIASYWTSGSPSLMRTWWSNGHLQREGHYIDWKKDGTWKSWNKNGNLKSEATYRLGVMDGRAFHLDEKSELISDVYYKDGSEWSGWRIVSNLHDRNVKWKEVWVDGERRVEYLHYLDKWFMDSIGGYLVIPDEHLPGDITRLAIVFGACLLMLQMVYRKGHLVFGFLYSLALYLIIACSTGGFRLPKYNDPPPLVDAAEDPGK